MCKAKIKYVNFKLKYLIFYEKYKLQLKLIECGTHKLYE